MKIKTFNFPNFEEWKNNSFNKIEINLGSYSCRFVCGNWKNAENHILFFFTPNDLTSTDNFSKNFFNTSFHYVGDTESFKKWYEDTISEFNDFWENYITETYLES